MKWSAQQLACIEMCLDPTRRLVAVTGPAGSGKTSLIKEVASRLEAKSVNYVVAAPTGKAAKRIREATGVPAITVHKLLEYGRPGERDKETGEALDTTTPSRGKLKPFDQTVVLVDEYSMITHELNRNLIDALPRGGRLLMFGDLAQLPPIENYVIKNADGSPFKEHLARPNVAFELTEIFRQAEGSDVLTAAHAIRRGIMPRRGENFQVHMTDYAIDKLTDLVFELQDQGIDFGSIKNQVLTPLKGKWIGTQAINVMLRNMLNPNGKHELALVRHSWDEKNPVSVAVGDKVVCTQNTYDMRNFDERYEKWWPDGKPQLHTFIETPETKMMFNGETGKIIDIYPDGGMEIDFGDRVVEIPYSYTEYWAKKSIFIDTFPQRDIDLAYALTVHKSQGSEYSNVIYVINSSVFYMLSRENIYTAVTRARDGAHIITDTRALQTSLRTTQTMIDKRNEANRKNKASLVK